MAQTAELLKVELLTTHQASPGVIFLSVVITINPRTGNGIIITDSLPEIYLVKFRVTGKRAIKSGKFRPDLIYAQDGYPYLNPREQGHLVQALNDAATNQIDMEVVTIKPSMIQLDGVDELPRRQLHLRIEL